MTIATQLTINDAAWEAGIAGARAQHNKTAQEKISTDDAFVLKVALDALETFKAFARNDIIAKVATLDSADLADLAPAIEAKVNAKESAAEIVAEAKP